MPRKRMIDPEFWSDEEIGQWSTRERLFYIGLWNFADDVGRFKAHNLLLKSQIFPYDEIRPAKITDLKQNIASKVIWYEVGGNQYGFLINFLKHQRIDKPSESKLPPPPEFGEASAKPRRSLPPKLSKVKISKVNRAWFSTIWEKYPNKDGKKAAEKAFLSSVKNEQDWQDINKALANYLHSEKVKAGYIKNGSTWFNNWQDWINFVGVKKKTQKELEIEKELGRQ